MAASWQDRDGGKTTLLSAYLASPIRHVFADQGFAGRLVDWAATRLNMRVEIVRKPAEQRGFAVHPRRWVVERSLAWLTAHHRLARDYERDPAVSEAFIRWVAINTMIRRLDRGRPAIRQTRRLLNPPEQQLSQTWPPGRGMSRCSRLVRRCQSTAAARSRASSTGLVIIGQWPESMSTKSRRLALASSGASPSVIHS
jgi:transposase